MSKDKSKKEQQKKGKLDRHLNQLAENSDTALIYKSGDTLKLIDKNRQIYQETDQAFIISVKKILKHRQNQYMKVIKQTKADLTTKQYEQLHFRAKIHGKANTINQNSHLDYNKLNQLDKCRCGCKKGKGKLISFCINDQKLKILGPGVLLQLLFQKSSAIIVSLLVVIYCLFAIITNYMGNQAVISNTCKIQLYCRFKQYTSDQNKDIDGDFQTVQNWLGVVFCFLWILALRVIRYVGKQKNRVIDENLTSAADKAIKVENLPRGTYEEQQLIGYLQGVWHKKLRKYFNQKHGDQNSRNISQQNILQNKKFKLKFKSIQIIYNMEFARTMIDEMVNLTQQIDTLWDQSIIDGSERMVIRRKRQYLDSKYKLISNYQLLEDLRKRFLNDSQFRKLISTTCCIIQFDSEKKRKAVLNFIGQERVGIFKRIGLRIRNLFNSSTRTTLFHHKVLRIQKAPEPSDILWQNCEKPESITRKLGIFAVTILVMAAAFGIIFGLTYLQEDVKLNPTKYSTSIETIVNNFIGIVLQIINKILWVVTSSLLVFQYNHTQTQKIISLMLRILILNSINVIALPIFSNYIVYGTQGVYGNNGLNGIVFDYHTSTIIAAAKGLFNITAIGKAILISIKWTRHKLLWLLLSETNIDKIDFKKGDPAINQFYQGIGYDIAENYMFIIIAILHAAFFCHLQPFIVIILLVMIIIFYLVNRTKILYFCKMPGLTQYLVFDTAVWMLGLVPLFYGAGTIAISFLQSKQNQNYPFNIVVCIPAIICLGLGFLGMSNPLGLLNKLMYWFTNKFIGNLQDPEVQQFDEDDFTEDEQQQLQQKQSQQQNIEQIRQKQKYSNTRMQSYYDQSNLLILLGFQRILKNQKLFQLRTQLQHYCQSFFPKQNSKEYNQNDGDKDANQNMAMGNTNKKQKIPYQLFFKNQANTITIRPRLLSIPKSQNYQNSRKNSKQQSN